MKTELRIRRLQDQAIGGELRGLNQVLGEREHVEQGIAVLLKIQILHCRMGQERGNVPMEGVHRVILRVANNGVVFDPLD
jgi:hypothetical protein